MYTMVKREGGSLEGPSKYYVTLYRVDSPVYVPCKTVYFQILRNYYVVGDKVLKMTYFCVTKHLNGLKPNIHAASIKRKTETKNQKHPLKTT